MPVDPKLVGRVTSALVACRDSRPESLAPKYTLQVHYRLPQADQSPLAFSALIIGPLLYVPFPSRLIEYFLLPFPVPSFCKKITHVT